jgi:hypothetical protein
MAGLYNEARGSVLEQNRLQKEVSVTISRKYRNLGKLGSYKMTCSERVTGQQYKWLSLPAV